MAKINKPHPFVLPDQEAAPPFNLTPLPEGYPGQADVTQPLPFSMQPRIHDVDPIASYGMPAEPFMGRQAHYSPEATPMDPMPQGTSIDTQLIGENAQTAVNAAKAFGGAIDDTAGGFAKMTRGEELTPEEEYATETFAELGLQALPMIVGGVGGSAVATRMASKMLANSTPLVKAAGAALADFLGGGTGAAIGSQTPRLADIDPVVAPEDMFSKEDAALSFLPVAGMAKGMGKVLGHSARGSRSVVGKLKQHIDHGVQRDFGRYKKDIQAALNNPGTALERELDEAARWDYDVDYWQLNQKQQDEVLRGMHDSVVREHDTATSYIPEAIKEIESRGYEIEAADIAQTGTVYVTVSKGEESYRIRFGDHEPNESMFFVRGEPDHFIDTSGDISEQLDNALSGVLRRDSELRPTAGDLARETQDTYSTEDYTSSRMEAEILTKGTGNAETQRASGGGQEADSGGTDSIEGNTPRREDVPDQGLRGDRRTVPRHRGVASAERSYEQIAFKDIEGAPAEGIEDIEKLAARFSEAPTETLRFIYVKDGKVVGHEAITMDDPGAAPILSQKETRKPAAGVRFVEGVRDRMGRLRADGYYLVHNHPSGEVTPTEQDLKLTKYLSQDIPGQLGHIVAHGRHATIIEPRGGYDPSMVVGTNPGRRNPTSDNPIIGRVVTSYRAAKDVGEIEGVRPDRGMTVLYLNLRGEVEAVEKIEASLLGSNTLPGYIDNMLRVHGADKSIGYPSGMELDEAAALRQYEAGAFTDVISSKGLSVAEDRGVGQPLKSAKSRKRARRFFQAAPFAIGPASSAGGHPFQVSSEEPDSNPFRMEQ